MMNGVVIYDVIRAENEILLRETERRQRLMDARASQSSANRFGRMIQLLAGSVRSGQDDCRDQPELREQLAGC